MDQGNAKEIVFLPIKPLYANAILNKAKFVEFRKESFPSSVSKVVIYSSSPEKKIIAWVEVEVIKTTIASAWRKYSKVGYISKKDYFDYYSEAKKGAVIIIKKVHPLKFNMSNFADTEIKSIPQSFCYLNSQQFLYIIKGK